MEEKRKLSRFLRQYVIIYYLKNEPNKTHDMSGILDISMGGLKFASHENYPAGTQIIFQIKFPFLYPNATKIEGVVVGTHQVVQGKTYKVGVQFSNLESQALEALEQMERLNQKMGK